MGPLAGLHPRIAKCTSQKLLPYCGRCRQAMVECDRNENVVDMCDGIHMRALAIDGNGNVFCYYVRRQSESERNDLYGPENDAMKTEERKERGREIERYQDLERWLGLRQARTAPPCGRTQCPVPYKQKLHDRRSHHRSDHEALEQARTEEQASGNSKWGMRADCMIEDC